MQLHFSKATIGGTAACLAVLMVAGAYLLAAGDTPSAGSNQPRLSRIVPSNDNLPKVRVKTIQPTRERLQKSSTQAAQVLPYEEADLFAKTSGYLEAVNVDIGDKVRKDQVLAEIWVPEIVQDRIHKEALLEKAKAEQAQSEAAIRAAESLLEAAKARVDEANSQVARYVADVKYRKIEYERHQQLFDERALQRDIVDEKSSQYEAAQASAAAARSAVQTAQANLLVEEAKLNQAQADLVGARARVKVAQAELDHATVLLNYAKVTAPYDGVITKRFFHPGAFIKSASEGNSSPLFHLSNVDRVRIVADVPEADSSWVREGQPAAFRVDALRGQHFEGKVARFADALDTDSRTMRVEVALNSPPVQLRAGMYGSVTITLADQEDALLLPASVLVTGGGEPAVMVANNGRAQRRRIEIGQNDGIRMHILNGISDRDRVIAEGKDEVRDGQPVEITIR
ncbi:MAG: efflux RND transporter periplasmic adaptor subunit [Pirellulales bacterium]